MENKFVAIGQFDGTVDLLKVELLTGQRQIISAKNVAKNQISFGLFEIEKRTPDLESVALLATPEGPILFLNEVQYRPDINKTKITIKDEGNFSHFQVLHDGKPIFGLFFEEKFGVGLHPYNNDREDIDFYYWLSKKINNQKFYQTYTREITYCGGL